MTKHPTATLVSALVGLAAIAATSEARANCAAGDDYGSSVGYNQVTVCPRPLASVNMDRVCPDPAGGLLRQRVDTGETVRLADFCTGSERYQGAANDCYLDECVEPGVYRYGFATPWDDPSCSTCPASQYFVEVDVQGELDAACVRSTGNSEPTPYAGSVPWGDESDMCNESAWGCSVAHQPRALVFGANALIAALGASLMLVRRRRSGR